MTDSINAAIFALILAVINNKADTLNMSSNIQNYAHAYIKLLTDFKLISNCIYYIVQKSYRVRKKSQLRKSIAKEDQHLNASASKQGYFRKGPCAKRPIFFSKSPLLLEGMGPFKM